MLGHLKKTLLDERGSAAPFIALCLMALISATGAAIDYARAQMVQTKLADTLDLAGLAAGASLSSQNYSTVVQNYFNVNFPPGFMQATVAPITITESADQTQLVLSASATVPTWFLGISGLNTMTVSANSEITRKASGLEIALVLDNTGSMAGSKLTSLKQAATDLTNILFGSDATKPDLFIGLVPFTQAVNIGTAHQAWLDPVQYGKLNWGNTKWGGCVDARVTNGMDITDDTPTTLKFPAYYWPVNTGTGNNWKLTSKASSFSSTFGPNAYCPQTTLGMTNVKADILAGINTMVAGGDTLIDLGIAWGWRMLSPKWRGLWGGAMDANKLPLDYNTPFMSKVAIIMTDGDNTIDNNSRGAYGLLKDNVLGTTNQTTALNIINSKVTAVCNAMKAQGIIVYTILFDQSSTVVGGLFKGCASNPSFYFNSPSNTDLVNAFHVIGDSLSNLRISQ